MGYDKNTIDADAEREGQAISKRSRTLLFNRKLQGFNGSKQDRLRQAFDYNKVEFDKLFRS